MSNILNQCESYNIDNINSSLMSITKNETSTISSLFFNIDGNKTNFDHFSVILKSIDHKFSAIGLAETNTDPEIASTFIIPGYTSYYQQTRKDKKSGSGVALYILNKFNATVIDDLSMCTNDIESIVIKITNLDKSVYFGIRGSL